MPGKIPRRNDDIFVFPVFVNAVKVVSTLRVRRPRTQYRLAGLNLNVRV